MINNLKKNSKPLSRRAFNTLLGSMGLAAVSSTNSYPKFDAIPKRVVVIGGGFGGATAAIYLKKMDPNIEVILIEKNLLYATCPFSNTVISGMNKFSYILKSYKYLEKRDIKVIHDLAIEIDASNKKIKLNSGIVISFICCIVSPGIDFDYESIIGNSTKIQNRIPHAWRAGFQTQLLRKQLVAMPNGGTFLISPPPNPFRCPPGPAERISLIADYFKKNKPKSKIIVLDPKDKFGKQSLFKEGWAKLYPNMIEYRNSAEFGTVREVVADKMVLVTDIDEVKGDVINLIPGQKAGRIAFNSGLVNQSGWCPVNHATFESKLEKDVYVIGDASISSPMPKSGVSAYSQAKVCAAAIVSSLNGEILTNPKFINYCYSLVSPDYGISVVKVYEFNGENIKLIDGAGGKSPPNQTNKFRRLEAQYAEGWYKTITKEIWG